MIAPLTQFAIRGVIWYQGETNTNYPDNYSDLLQTLIADWRFKWNNTKLPFFIVQLPNYMEASTQPQESNWAMLRYQQWRTTQVTIKTSLITTVDLGEWNELHPENKKDVGRRIAWEAMWQIFNDYVMPGSPEYWSSTIVNNKIVIEFTSTGNGLIIKGGGSLKHFAIAGADRKFVWANAIIKAGKVVVWNDNIKHPAYVRYAWADNPVNANLYNKENFPATPFEATIDK
jgi:sialate O-acetylesterase